MEPEDVFRQPPVYKQDQVITQQDLIDAIRVLEMEYQSIPAIYILERHGIEIALKTLDTMLDWVIAGKPQDFNTGGNHNA